MTVLKVLTHPHPLLQKRAEKVEHIDAEVLKNLDDMEETLKGQGIGLAANQVGILKRLLVMNMGRRTGKDEPTYKMINPEITWTSETMCTMGERCLSLPETTVEVERPEFIRFAYTNVDGERVEVEGDALMSRCFQHELDHLNGKLAIHHLSKLKRDLLVRKMMKRASA